MKLAELANSVVTAIEQSPGQQDQQMIKQLVLIYAEIDKQMKEYPNYFYDSETSFQYYPESSQIEDDKEPVKFFVG